MRNGEPNIYGALAALRSGQTLVQWNRMQMVAVFNSIALPIVIGTGQPEIVKFVISAAGLALHIGILVASRRGDKWIKYWDARMVELENLDQKGDSETGTRVRVFSRPDFQTMRGVGLTSRRIFAFFGVLVTLLWVEETARHLINTL